MTTKNLPVLGTCLLLGGWVLVCPWVISDIGPPASWHFHVAGGLAILLTIVALLRTDDLAEYGLIAVGAWLIIAPWVLGLSDVHTRQTIFYGVILAGVAWFGRASLNQPKTDSPA
jgi:hypothetical protein